jgi:ankyrin repeat protein/mono/diheme cytochrome c family protein
MRPRLRDHAWLVVLVVTAGLGATGHGAGAAATLVDAVKNGDRAAVRTLLKSRSDVNLAEPDGTTALHWAVRADDEETVRLLLRAGANTKVANRYGVSPIMLAANNANPVILDALLKAGADPNATAGEAGETALMVAARNGRPEALRVLLAHGANVNGKGFLGETALMWAAAHDQAPAVRLLIEGGAEVNGRSVLSPFPKLVFPGMGLNEITFPTGGWTPLMYAARQGTLGAAQALVDAKADVNLTAPDGATALVLAIINAHYDVAQILLDKGADPNLADETGMAALYAAVDMNTLAWTHGRPGPAPSGRLDSVDIIRSLLDHGADPNATLTTPTARRHHNDAPGFLGAGTTPLMRAASAGDAAAVRLLLARGANPALVQKNRTTPLMLASGLGWNANPDVPAGRGAEAELLETVKIFLTGAAATAGVDAVNENGDTALHGAAASGADAIVQLLVENGAALNVVNKRGRTPLDVALEKTRTGETLHPATGALIRKLGGTPAPATAGRPAPATAKPAAAEAVVSRKLTIWDGVYKAEQAERGKAVFQTHCSTCHASDLTGSSAPALVGEGFTKPRDFTNLNQLFTQIRTRMPQNAPASLTDAAYLDAMTYILQGNRFPAGGEELRANAASLEGIVMITNKDGLDAEEIPAGSLVQLVGCLEGADKAWTLTQATKPLRVGSPAASKGDERQKIEAAPFGSGSFRLLGILDPVHKGHKVETKGLLIKDPGGDRINVVMVETIGASCAP